jgi:DNA-binding NtrC family response regulator
MKPATSWDNPETEIIDSLSANEDSTSSAAHSPIGTLKELALRLMHEVQSISEVPSLNVNAGLDFYDEVHRFEIELIKRALLHTGGHQGRAARLLNLKVTTLNSKIKHYEINPARYALGYQLLETPEVENRQPA